MRKIISAALFFLLAAFPICAMVEESDRNLDAIAEKIVTNTKKYFKPEWPELGSFEYNLKLWLSQSDNYQGAPFDTTTKVHFIDESTTFPFFFDIFCTILSDSPEISWTTDSDHLRWLTNLVFNLPTKVPIPRLINRFLDPITQLIPNYQCLFFEQNFTKKSFREKVLLFAVIKGLQKRIEKEKDQQGELQQLLEYYLPIALYFLPEKFENCGDLFGVENCKKGRRIIDSYEKFFEQIPGSKREEVGKLVPVEAVSTTQFTIVQYVFFSTILRKMVDDQADDDDLKWVKRFYVALGGRSGHILRVAYGDQVLQVLIQHYIDDQRVFDTKRVVLKDSNTEVEVISLSENAKVAAAIVRLARDQDPLLQNLLKKLSQLSDDVLSIMAVGLLYKRAEGVKVDSALIQILRALNSRGDQHILYKDTKKWAQQNGYDMKVFVEAEKSLLRRYLLYILGLLGLGGISYMIVKKKKINITIPLLLTPWVRPPVQQK
jgi:hypothetical protein